jgi:hypothetical protein
VGLPCSSLPLSSSPPAGAVARIGGRNGAWSARAACSFAITHWRTNTVLTFTFLTHAVLLCLARERQITRRKIEKFKFNSVLAVEA